MYLNPNPDEYIPQSEENTFGDGMNVKTKQDFLEVERNPYLLNADDYKTLPELLNGYTEQYLRHRKAHSTAQKHTRILQRMTQHPVYPINLWNLNPIQIIHYLDYREHIEQAGKHAIRNEYKAIRKYAQLQGIDTTKWGYIAPSPPPSKIRIVPLPQQVKQLLTHKYTKNKLENLNIQYHLTYGFLWGLRPDEYSMQLTENIRLSDGYIFIIEGKKHYQIRQLFPEPELLTNPRRKSLLNLLKLHDRINPQNPYLFIQHNGRPWTTAYLRKWLTAYVKPLYPEYSMYTMRHWCAIARLITSYIQTGTWDKEDVKDWLGHDDLRTTDDYTKYAKKYYKLAPFDWIKAILKQPKQRLEENSLDQRTPQTLNISNPATGDARYEPTGIFTKLLLLKRLKKTIFTTFSTSNSIFFSFFNTRRRKQQPTNQHEGSQFNGVVFSLLHYLSSSKAPHHLSEIPIPLTKGLLLRARKFFILFYPPICFLQNYPSPISYNNTMEGSNQ